MSGIATRVTNALAARSPIRAAQLRVVDGPDRGLEIDLPAVGVVLGSDPACDVPLTDTFVSRRHCSVAPHAQGFAIVDLGSKNGTIIDGALVGKVVAPPGVCVRIGHTLVAHSRPSTQAVVIALFLALVGLAMAIYLVSVHGSVNPHAQSIVEILAAKAAK